MIIKTDGCQRSVSFAVLMFVFLRTCAVRCVSRCLDSQSLLSSFDRRPGLPTLRSNQRFVKRSFERIRLLYVEIFLVR